MTNAVETESISTSSPELYGFEFLGVFPPVWDTWVYSRVTKYAIPYNGRHETTS